MDFYKICRTCLGEIRNSISLFNHHYINEEHLKLSEILTACTSIEVLENDNLPKQVCIQCENNILNTFRFQEQCHKSNSFLKAMSSSVQSELPELKSDISCKSSVQHSIILSNDTLEQKVEKVNKLDNGIENFNSSLDKAIKIEIDTEEMLNDNNDCLVSPGADLENACVHFSKEVHIESASNRVQQEEHCGNSLSSSCNTNSINSQNIELKPSGISSRQDQIVNLDGLVNGQLTTVKILKEENDCFVNSVNSLQNIDENFNDQGHIESTTYNLEGEQHVNDLSCNNYQSDSTHVQHKELKSSGISIKNTSKQDDLVEAVNVELTSVKILKEDNDRFVSTVDSVENVGGNVKDQEYIESTIYNLSSNDQNSAVSSQHIEIKPSGVSSKHTFKQEQVNNSEEVVTSQLTSVKILNEDSDDDERNFADEGHNDSVSYSFNENYENDLFLHYHTGGQQNDPNDLPKQGEDETLQPLFPCLENGCVVCFTTLEDLKEHSKVHHSRCCEICNETFCSASSLSRHMSRYHPNKNQCSDCGKRFVRLFGPGSLASHMKTHTQATVQKNFVCNFCKKCFTTSRNLIVHKRIHTDERNRICRICHKGFIQKSLLDAHMVIHTDERNHICSICNTGFNQKGTLKAHMKIHTEEKSFTCNICSKSFSHSVTCWAHMKAHKQKEKLDAGEEITL